MSNKRMILPSIFERNKDLDTEDDGALFKGWTYKNTVDFDVAFYIDDRNTIYFNFRRPSVFYSNNYKIDQTLIDDIYTFERKYTEVSRDKLFGNQSAIEELEELCERIYRELNNK